MSTRIEYILQLIDEASDELRTVERSADGAADGLDDAGRSADRTQDRFSKMAKTARNTAAVMGTVAAVAAAKFAKSTVSLASDLEMAETQLAVLTGSSEVAGQRIDELFKLTTETPFLFPDLVDAEVALTSFGANAQEMLPSVIDVAAALGQDVAGAAHAVGKAFGAGAAGADALRERMPKVFALIKEELGDRTGDVDAFREALTNALSDETFAGGAERLSNTFAGAFSNLQGQITEFQVAIADAKLFDAVKNTLVAANEVIDSIQANVDDLGKEIGTKLTKAFFLTLQTIAQIADGIHLLGAVIQSLVNGAINALGLALSGILGLFLEIGGIATVLIPGESEFGKKLNALKRQNRAFFKEQAVATVDAFVSPVANAMKVDFSNVMDEIVGKARLATGTPSDEAVTLDTGGTISAQEHQKQQAEALAKAAEASDAALKSFSEQLSSFSQLPIEERAEKMRELVKAAEQLPDLIPMEDYLEALHELQELENDIAEKQIKALEDQKKALDEIRAIQIQSFQEVGDALGSVISGGIGAVTSLLGMLGPQGAAVGAFVGAFHALGEKGADEVASEFSAAFDTVLSGILELPDLLTEALPDVMARLVEGLIENAPQIAIALGEALLLAMPSMVAAMIEGLFNGLVGIVDRILTAIGLGQEGRESIAQVGRVAFGIGTFGRSELLAQLFGADSFQTGGYVDRTGLALVHAGEHITPAGGVPSGDADRMGARGGSSGANVTINTSVVDPNTIPALVREIERVFGTNGRGTSPLFA